MKTLIACIRREYWENRGLFLSGAIIFSVLVLLAVLVFVGMIVSGHGQAITASTNLNVIPQGEIALALYIGAAPFALIFWIVTLYYFTSCLYRDRKDGSVFFWQSLPVSQTQTLLSKLIAGLILAPLLIWLCVIALQLILMVLASFVLPTLGLSVVAGHLWHPLAMIKGWLMILAAFYLQALWMLPVIGWFMLCSAFASRAVLLVASLPLIALAFVQHIFQHNIALLNMFTKSFQHLTVTWLYCWELLTRFVDATGVQYAHGVLTVNQPVTHLASFFSVDMVWGAIVCGVFVVIAGYLRRRCFGYES